MCCSPYRIGRLCFLAVAIGCGAAACQYFQKGDDGGGTLAGDAAAIAAGKVARATIEARSGSEVSGEAVFTETDGEVAVVVRVTGASPGKHAVHVHEKGDCSAEDGTSAGGHFNPDGHPHGRPDTDPHHAGDFGNIEIGEDGSGVLELVTDDLTVSEGDRSVVGRSIIVHAKEDDFGQPTGNAGGRIGCGEIRAVEAAAP